MADQFEITMEKMVYGGDCLGRLPDGRAIFVPFVLPGEVVRVEVTEEKARFARGYPVEVLTASPDRIQRRCLHFQESGGCQYQPLGYAKQLRLTEAIIKAQFQRIAKLDDPPIQPIIASPNPWNYRNHIQFHLGANDELGYIHVDGEHLLPIQECHLPQALINALWPQIDLGGASGVSRLSIRVDSWDSLMIVMEGEDATPPEFSVDIPISAIYAPPDARLTVLAGDDHLIYTLNHRTFRVSARSFFQVNNLMAEKMVDFLLEHLHLESNFQAVELYAGVGLFSAFIAPHVSYLTAIESSGAACHDFAVNLDEFDNVDLY
ncbi:MAG: TRAM domain-containing protein, partial [Mesotoga sp.]|nr:TRAM domain-containing protein [Mesotoga sp.]